MARRKWNKDTIQQVMADENPFLQVGYKPAEVQRKLGERWVDVKGITWEQRKGYKMRINIQVESIRELIKQECSTCKKDIHMFGTDYDKKFFPKTGRCYDCNIDEHSKMRINGTFEQHEQRTVWSNQLSYLKDIKQHLEDSIAHLIKDDTKMEWVHSDGTISTWTGAKISEFVDSAQKDLEQVNQGIKELEESLLKFAEVK